MAAPVPERPLLKPWYRLLELPDGLLLEHGRAVVSFSGRAATVLLPRLLPLLDGSRTEHEVVAAVGERVEPAVRNALALLAEHGLLAEGPDVAAGPTARTASYLSQLSTDPPGEVASRLADARVLVEGDGALVQAVERLLRRCGVGRAGHDDRPDLILTAAAVEGAPILERRNAEALEHGVTWLPLGCFDGRTACVGPLVVPGETACHRCLVIRRDACSPGTGELRALRAVPVRARVAPPLLALVAALGAERAVRWLGIRDPALPGALTTIEAGAGLRVREDVLLRVPRCPACSASARTALPLPWHEAAWEAS